MTTLWLDTECFSEADLFRVGLHRYAEDPSTEITVVQWAVDDGEPRVHDCTGGAWNTAHYEEFRAALFNPDVIIKAHNSSFDRTILRHTWGIDIPVERWRCTMVQAMVHGLPGALGKLGPILGMPVDLQKDRRGDKLVKMFCKPNPANWKTRRNTRLTHPTEWQEFLEYSRQDIVSMREMASRLPTWNWREEGRVQKLWFLDQRINDRGFQVDVDLAHAAVAATKDEKARIDEEMMEASDGGVRGAGKRADLLAHILMEYGVNLKDTKADTLRKCLDDPELPDGVKLLLSLRLEGLKTSTAKYASLLRAVCRDHRLRGGLQFSGAQRTMRWAGRLFQPQNMPRPSHGFEIEAMRTGVAALKAGVAQDLYENTMQLTADTVRGCIVAKPRHKLVVADLSNIEGRGLAWLAGEKWKLKAFADYDQGIGADLYRIAFAKAFNIPVESVDKNQRQQGKVMELGCLAGDTPTVTNRGIIRLDSVTTEDLLWDGSQWVKHDGLIAKGIKPVVNIAGIELTPDHLIKTGPTWTQAQELASSESILCRALATASVNLPSWVRSEKSAELASTTWCGFNALAALSRIWCSITTCAKVPAPGAVFAHERRRVTGASSTTATQIYAPTKTTDAGYWTAYLLASTGATTLKTPAFQTTAAAAYAFTNRGAKTGGLFWRISLLFRGGTTRFWSWTERMWTKATNRATYALSPSVRTTATAALSERCSSASLNSKPVFDILNAGPNSCFTVMTERGPLIAHNCGYEGGVAAFLTFAAVYNMDLDAMADAVHRTAPKDVLAAAYGMWEWAQRKKRTLGLSRSVYTACEALKAMWRAAHPATTELWKALGEGVVNATLNPGVTYTAGEHLKIRRDGSWLRIRLPSGRYLCYLRPEVDENGGWSYMGVNQYTKQWTRIKSYGGKLAENCTQAWALDVLTENMPLIEGCGYEIVLSVHDELLTECPDEPEFTAEALGKMMSHRPPWAPDVPLAAAGFETERYYKEA